MIHIGIAKSERLLADHNGRANIGFGNLFIDPRADRHGKIRRDLVDLALPPLEHIELMAMPAKHQLKLHSIQFLRPLGKHIVKGRIKGSNGYVAKHETDRVLGNAARIDILEKIKLLASEAYVVSNIAVRIAIIRFILAASSTIPQILPRRNEKYGFPPSVPT